MVVAEALCQVSSWPKQKGHSKELLVIVGHLGQIKTDICCRSEPWNDDTWTWGRVLENHGLNLSLHLSAIVVWQFSALSPKLRLKCQGASWPNTKNSRPVKCCPAIFDFHSSIKSWVMSHGCGWSLVPGVIMAQNQKAGRNNSWSSSDTSDKSKCCRCDRCESWNYNSLQLDVPFSTTICHITCGPSDGCAGFASSDFTYSQALRLKTPCVRHNWGSKHTVLAKWMSWYAHKLKLPGVSEWPFEVQVDRGGINGPDLDQFDFWFPMPMEYND